jgi:tetratricopeptide (TPR) repeat protein
MSDAVWDAFQRYQELEKEGRYGEAIPFAQEVVRLAEEEFGSEHEHVGISLNNLALLYANQGRYAEAEPLYLRSLTIKEKALGPEHPSVATTLSNLAALYANQGRYAEAEPLFQRALVIREKALGPDHPDVATAPRLLRSEILSVTMTPTSAHTLRLVVLPTQPRLMLPYC